MDASRAHKPRLDYRAGRRDRLPPKAGRLCLPKRAVRNDVLKENAPLPQPDWSPNERRVSPPAAARKPASERAPRTLSNLIRPKHPIGSKPPTSWRKTLFRLKAQNDLHNFLPVQLRTFVAGDMS